MFREWSQELPASIDCLAVEFPGRGGRLAEPPCRRVEDLATATTDALAPWFEEPYLMFGHSLGALVAFEMVRRLVAQGRPPLHLFVSGSRAPHVARTADPAHGLERHAFKARLATWGGAPAVVMDDDDMFALFERSIRADLEAAETYQHSGPHDLGVPITAFSGIDDPLVPHEMMLPWSAYTSGYFSLRRIPGNHFFLKDARPLLLQLLASELDLAAFHRPSQ
jgi:medium-chain acyl-[acyl-carrier-protein] hydrolase